MDYPLYDVPYLARDPNEYRMSEKRHQIEVRNQAVVDDYFLTRDKGASAECARLMVAQQNGIPVIRVNNCLRWYYQQALRRGKYSFLYKFPPSEEHIVHF